MGGSLQQKAYSQQRALSFFCFFFGGLARRSEKQQGVVCNDPVYALELLHYGLGERDVGNPLFNAVSGSRQRTSDEAENHSWDFKVSEPPWHEQVLLTSPSRQIQWRGGGRNMLTQRQIAGGSGWKPGGGQSQEIKSLSGVRGSVRSLRQSLPWFARLRLCYETCESTRTKGT